jgi:hypothetical protein
MLIFGFVSITPHALVMWQLPRSMPSKLIGLHFTSKPVPYGLKSDFP